MPGQNRQLIPVDPPVQFDTLQFGLALKQVETLIRAREARETFEVNGSGLTAAVVDTGLRTTHVDFAGRVVAQLNLTSDNGDDEDNADDGNGHGTNVGGIVVANGDHTGMAPGANILPIKVLSNDGGGSFDAVADALQWVLDHRDTFNITSVCMSLGAGDNETGDQGLDDDDPIRERILALRERDVAVVIAAGNDYFTHGSAQGMSYPGIIRQCVSVGAVYDDFEGEFAYANGARAFSASPDQITPFSQRLHESVHPDCRTDIFAPGAPVTSSGINNDHGESVQQGTSQAAPVVAGVILLMQQFHLRLTGRLPTVDQLVEWMRRGGVDINDGDDEDDNVGHTGLDFPRISAFGALEAIRRELQKAMAFSGQPLRPGS